MIVAISVVDKHRKDMHVGTINLEIPGIDAAASHYDIRIYQVPAENEVIARPYLDKLMTRAEIEAMTVEPTPMSKPSPRWCAFCKQLWGDPHLKDCVQHGGHSHKVGGDCHQPPGRTSHAGTPEVQLALDIAFTYGAIDGEHHKMWVIDQMVRLLTGDAYEEWVKDRKGGVDGPDTYEWNEGIAP